MVPINTQSMVLRLPTKRSFNGFTTGAKRAAPNMPGLKPGGMGNFCCIIGIKRASSVLASCHVAPCLRRAMPSKLKFPTKTLPRSKCIGTSIWGLRLRKRNDCGKTPTISRGCESARMR